MTTAIRFASLRDAPLAGSGSRIAPWLLAALFLGAVTVLSLPAARADSAALGWMPMWLLGMPLASLCTLAVLELSRLRLPRRRPLLAGSVPPRQRQPGRLQARRRGAVPTRLRLPRAA